MHIYRISYNKGSLNVEAETPQKAIEKLYKNNVIHIEPSCKNNASHKVELIDAERSSTKYYNVKICNSALNRKVMKAFEVIDTLKIGSNTSIIIKDKGIELQNGTALLDDNGKPYVVLSVGMNNDKGNIETTTLLLEGDFKSKRIFI